jgi:hypothetical protein
MGTAWWMVGVGAVVVAVAGVMIFRRRPVDRRDRSTDGDLGSVSEGWLAEQRGRNDL